jgi:hypothetical protein
MVGFMVASGLRPVKGCFIDSWMAPARRGNNGGILLVRLYGRH